MPFDDVVDAYDEVGDEPEDDDWREAVPKLAGAQALEDEQEDQDGAGDPNDPGCSIANPFKPCPNDTLLQAQSLGGARYET